MRIIAGRWRGHPIAAPPGKGTVSRGARHATLVERGGAALRTLRANVRKLGAGSEARVVRADALRFAEELPLHAYDIALADPPYDTGAAEALVRLFLRHPFARMLWIEHRVSDPLPETEDMETRRYGDTLLTFYPAPE